MISSCSQNSPRTHHIPPGGSRPEALCSLQQGDGTFEISRSDLPLATQGTKDYTIYPMFFLGQKAWVKLKGNLKKRSRKWNIFSESQAWMHVVVVFGYQLFIASMEQTAIKCYIVNLIQGHGAVQREFSRF